LLAPHPLPKIRAMERVLDLTIPREFKRRAEAAYDLIVETGEFM